MFNFVVHSWNWIALQDWWQRGIIGALLGAVIFIIVPAAISFASKKEPSAIGGKGGSGIIVGGGGTIVGGRGGDAFQSGGRGGEGGSGSISGGNGLIVGGDGGNTGSPDGRGGKPTRSPGEVAGLPTELWKYGRGGAGGNHPEYNRRLELLNRIRAEYMNEFPDTAPFIQAGVDQVPASWVNKRLEELGEPWRVVLEDGHYRLPPLPK